MDHDAAEAAAMAEHYAAPPGPDLPSPDPVAAGLAHGFEAGRHRSSAAVNAERHCAASPTARRIPRVLDRNPTDARLP